MAGIGEELSDILERNIEGWPLLYYHLVIDCSYFPW